MSFLLPFPPKQIVRLCCFARKTLGEGKTSVPLGSRLIGPSSSINCIRPHHATPKTVYNHKRNNLEDSSCQHSSNVAAADLAEKTYAVTRIWDFYNLGEPQALCPLRRCQHLMVGAGRGGEVLASIPLHGGPQSQASFIHSRPIPASPGTPCESEVANFNL